MKRSWSLKMRYMWKVHSKSILNSLLEESDKNYAQHITRGMKSKDEIFAKSPPRSILSSLLQETAKKYTQHITGGMKSKDDMSVKSPEVS